MSVWSRVKKAIEQADDIDDLVLDYNKFVLDQVSNFTDEAISPAFNYWMDNPDIKRAIGNARYGNAKWGVGRLPDGLVDVANDVTMGIIDKPEDYDEDVTAYEKGYNGRSGGRAVWEANMGRRGALKRGIFDIAADPTTLASLGSGSIASLSAKGSARIAAGGLKNRAVGEAFKGAAGVGRIYQVPDKAVDAVAANTIGRMAKKPTFKKVFDISEREAVRKMSDGFFAVYKTANRAIKGDYQTEGFDAAIATGRNAIQPVGTHDMDRVVKNAWNAANSGRPITEQDVGDRLFEAGPYVEAAGGPVTMVDMAENARKTAIDDTTFVKTLGANHPINQKLGPGNPGFRPKWNKGADEKEIRGVLQSYGKTKKEQAMGIRPLDPHEIEETMDIVSYLKPLGMDPLHTPEDQIFGAILKRDAAEDPTILGIGKEANAALQTKLTKGEYKGFTRLEALQDLERRFVEDQNTVINAVGPKAWKFRARKETIEQMLRDSNDKDAMRAWKTWEEEGVDLMHHPVEESAYTYFEKFLYSEANVDTARRKSKMASIAAVWKGQALLSPRYHTSNISGAYFNTILTQGFKGLPNPKEFWDQIRYAAKEDPNKIDVLAPDMPASETMERWGIARPNKNVGMGVTSDLASASSREHIEHAFGRVIGQSISRPIGAAFDFNRRIGVAVDAVARSNVWNTKFQSVWYENEHLLRTEIENVANKQGLVLDPDIETIPFEDPEKLLGYYKGLGFSEGNSIHLSREAARIRNIADKDAVKQVHKGLFSYYRTPFDEMIQKVVPFHYYASRSTILYAESMMRNPVLLVNFARLAEELFRGYENSGMNARQKGWVNVMGSHFGFNLLMNPDALLGFTRAMGLMGDNYESDETSLGGILKWMKAGGYGMYPWIDSTFNMLGAYGDTFEPDVLGVRHRALVGSAVNYAAAELGFGEGQYQAAFYAEANAKAREHISQWGSALLPGWLSQPVKAKANDTGTIAEASFERLVESRIITNNPNITNEELFHIMNDPDNPEYQNAYKEIARSGVLNQIMSFTLPVGLKFREAETDVRHAALNETYETARKLGINAEDLTPAADANFAARYKARTGRDWSPKDFNVDQARKNLYDATPRARPYIIQLEQYEKLGTELGRKTIREYYKVKNGESEPYGPLPEDQREKAADMWLAEQGPQAISAMNETQAIQSLYRQQFPEIDQYKNWTGQMSYLEKLSGGTLALYREKVSQGNPSAAKFFEDKKNQLIKKHKKIEDFQEAMDRATTTFDAYLAVNGIEKEKFDQQLPPTSNGGIFDPAQPMIDEEQVSGGGISTGSAQTGERTGRFDHLLR
jgi:hypothetical protein